MACSCASNAQYTYTAPSGAKTPYRTFGEAQAAQTRAGGGGTIVKTR